MGKYAPYFEISSKWKSRVFVADGLFRGDELPAALVLGGG
jgi:hypothetical protein